MCISKCINAYMLAITINNNIYYYKYIIIKYSEVIAITKYDVKCSRCGYEQVYKPRGKIPKDPHTACAQCGTRITIKIKDAEEIKNAKPKNCSNDKRLDANMKITKESLEPLIARELMRNASPQMLKIAVDFCKINDTDEEVGEIDLSKFLKNINIEE